MRARTDRSRTSHRTRGALWAALIVLVAMVTAGCAPVDEVPLIDRRLSGTPEDHFRWAVADPVPPDVTDIHSTGDSAVGDTWIYLRFTATSSWLDDLVSDGRYSEVSCSDSEVERILNMPPGPREKFEEASGAVWSPWPTESSRCHRMSGKVPGFTKNASVTLLYEPDSTGLPPPRATVYLRMLAA